LIEGDGSIKVPKTARSDKGKLLTPSVTIVFVAKDLPLANFIATILSGTVNKAKGNYYVLSIYKQSALHTLCKIINGKFRTPKIEALHRLIHWLNDKNKFEKLELLPLDETNILNNSWLAGFSDADSNFSINFKTYFNTKEDFLMCSSINLTYRISQRQEYQRSTPNQSNSYLNIMSKIAAAFNSKVEIIDRERLDYTEKGYLVRVRSNNSRLEVINYFNNFSLLSSKHLDFLAWKEANILQTNRDYLTAKGSAKLIELKSSMNTSRTFFDWKHLDDFIQS
jgi:hypothetical protein